MKRKGEARLGRACAFVVGSARQKGRPGEKGGLGVGMLCLRRRRERGRG